MGVRISALVCAHNQEARLGDCLRRLSFCDEIVVVADSCTDRTREIARRAGAVVIDGIFPLEGHRKRAGEAACSGEWILEIEPDERVESALAWEIRATLQARPTCDAFSLSIDNYIGAERVRHGWSPALGGGGARLFRRGAKAWTGGRIDAGRVISGHRMGMLTGALRRDLGRDIGEVLERFNRQNGLRAEDLADAGVRTGAPVAVARGVGAFFSGLLLRSGWREGRLGMLAALLSGLDPVLANLRSRELQARRRERPLVPQDAAPLPKAVGFGAR